MAKAAVKKPPTKTEIFASVAEQTGLTKKEIAAVFNALAKEIAKAVGKKGAGAFTIPGLCKIVRQHKAAQGKHRSAIPKRVK